MVRKFNPAQHPRDKRGRFTKSRTVKASAGDKKAARQVADGFSPAAAGSDPQARKAYLAGFGGKADLSSLGAANRALRGGKDSPAAERLDQAMVELPGDLLLSRAVPSSAFGNTDPAALEGMKVRDAGFAPAQLGTVQAAEDQVRMHIATPAGTRAVVDPETGEVVLDRDTEMVVARVEPNAAGGHDMWLTVLPKKITEQGPDPAPSKAGPETPKPGDETAGGGDQIRADLMKLKVPELRQQMKDRGLKPGKLRKSQMVDALVADETGDGSPGQSDPAAGGSVADRITAKVADLADGPTGLVGLETLREELPEIGRADFDAELLRLNRERVIQLDPDPDRRKLTDRRRAAAVVVGGEDMHLVSMRPSAGPEDEPPARPQAEPGTPEAALAAAPFGMDRGDGSEKDWPPGLRRHLSAYRLGSDQAINTALRSPDADPAKEQRYQIRGIDAGMEESKLTAGVQVFRGVRKPQALFGDRMSGDLTGMAWREDAYVSTSVVPKVAEDFTADRGDPDAIGMVMNIAVPKGVGGIELSPVTFEGELLLDRGHQFKVVKDRGVVGGARRVDVEVLPKVVP